jgi:hypothetical protein
VIDRLISYVAPSGYGSVAIAGESSAAWASDEGGEAGIDAGAHRTGEGALRISGESGDLVLGVSALTSPLGFETAEGTQVDAQAVQVSGEHPALAGFEGPGVAWSFRFDEVEPAAVRCLWASSGKGLLVGFAIRPAGSSEHGFERVGFARIARGGTVTAFEQPLLSTEYDAAGSQRRATLELWTDEGTGLRGGGRRERGGRALLPGGVLEAAGFAWSIDGEPAIGGYDIVRD